MATKRYDRTETRILNPHGRRHYRRRYSVREVGAGAVVLAGLLAVAGWVAWKGAHPDPTLFATSDDLLDPGMAIGERGALPAELAPEGWAEGRPAVFDESNLYEKINGRANYFTSRGFVELAFVALNRGADAWIDIELYDMGSAENALGAYAGEKSPEVESTAHPGGLWHLERNALYLTRGPYYVRAIGSEESEAMTQALAALQPRFAEGLGEGEGADDALPWAHRLFDGLGIPPGRVTFQKESAFSFGFAPSLYIALADDEETELFVAGGVDAASGAALIEQFRDGFASYGEVVEGEDDPWVRDEYLGAYSVAAHEGTFLYGVRGAPDLEAAKAQLADLGAAVAALEPVEVERAEQAPVVESALDEY